MTEPITEPITQRECRERLYEAVCTGSDEGTISAEDCAEWIVALLSLAALLAGIAEDRHQAFVDRAVRVMREIKQEAAGEDAGGQGSGTDTA